jgi:hypothetical protein
MLSHRGDAGRQTARQADQDVFDPHRAVSSEAKTSGSVSKSQHNGQTAGTKRARLNP